MIGIDSAVARNSHEDHRSRTLSCTLSLQFTHLVWTFCIFGNNTFLSNAFGVVTFFNNNSFVRLIILVVNVFPQYYNDHSWYRFVSGRITQQSHQAYLLIFIGPPTTQLNAVNWLICSSKVILYCIFVYFISSLWCAMNNKTLEVYCLDTPSINLHNVLPMNDLLFVAHPIHFMPTLLVLVFGQFI